MRQPLVHAWGREAVAAMETVFATEPPLDLTLRPGFAAPEGEVLPTGSLRLASAGQVSALPGYAEGGWWVQDAAAALPARLLDVRPGERVLDLCAAPGGKTLQLAAAGASVVALDVSGPRLARLHENLARTGLAAEVVAADALAWTPDAAFDAILLDAPCSATGTVRRHPDLAFVKDGSEVAGLVALQAALIDRALGWLRPAGGWSMRPARCCPRRARGSWPPRWRGIRGWRWSGWSWPAWSPAGGPRAAGCGRGRTTGRTAAGWMASSWRGCVSTRDKADKGNRINRLYVGVYRFLTFAGRPGGQRGEAIAPLPRHCFFVWPGRDAGRRALPDEGPCPSNSRSISERAMRKVRVSAALAGTSRTTGGRAAAGRRGTARRTGAESCA